MAQAKLNLTEHIGKDTINVKVPNIQGLYLIHDWCSKTKRYRPRTAGLKYYAYKKIGCVQKTKCFESFQQAKAWRESSDIFMDETVGSEVLFKEVKQKFFEKKKGLLRISTYETYESNAKHLTFFDDLPMIQITPKAIDHWLSQMKSPSYLALQHRSRLSYHHELSLLR